MTEQDLLKRIEEQAAEIAKLKASNDELVGRLEQWPKRLQEERYGLLRSMAEGAVNCGMHSGCSLARRYLP